MPVSISIVFIIWVSLIYCDALIAQNPFKHQVSTRRRDSISIEQEAISPDVIISDGNRWDSIEYMFFREVGQGDDALWVAAQKMLMYISGVEFSKAEVERQIDVMDTSEKKNRTAQLRTVSALTLGAPIDLQIITDSNFGRTTLIIRRFDIAMIRAEILRSKYQGICTNTNLQDAVGSLESFIAECKDEIMELPSHLKQGCIPMFGRLIEDAQLLQHKYSIQIRLNRERAKSLLVQIRSSNSLYQAGLVLANNLRLKGYMNVDLQKINVSPQWRSSVLINYYNDHILHSLWKEIEPELVSALMDEEAIFEVLPIDKDSKYEMIINLGKKSAQRLAISANLSLGRSYDSESTFCEVWGNGVAMKVSPDTPPKDKSTIYISSPDYVRVMGVNNNWARVEYIGTTGKIREGYIFVLYLRGVGQYGRGITICQPYTAIFLSKEDDEIIKNMLPGEKVLIDTMFKNEALLKVLFPDNTEGFVKHSNISILE